MLTLNIGFGYIGVHYTIILFDILEIFHYKRYKNAKKALVIYTVTK